MQSGRNCVIRTIVGPNGPTNDADGAEVVTVLENPKVISRGRVAQIGEHLLRQQRVNMKSNSSYSFNFNEMARPRGRFQNSAALQSRRDDLRT